MEIDVIVDTVTGYGDGFQRVQSSTGMSPSVLIELLLDHNVEQCKNCKWFAESHELVDEHSHPDGYCDNCRRYDKPVPT